MWVLDRETLRFLAVNDAAIYKYGYTRGEFLCMTNRGFTHPDDALLLNCTPCTEEEQPRTSRTLAASGTKDGAASSTWRSPPSI